MKEEYFVWGGIGLLQLGYLGYFLYRKWRFKHADVEIADWRWKTYLKLRENILLSKPEDFGITLPYDNETAFAVAMELHLGEILQFVVAFATGTVWAFNTKNARKNQLGKNNENVKSAAIAAIATAQYHFARMRRNYANGLEPGYIKFHILTGDDCYSINASLTEIRSENSPWTELYHVLSNIVVEEQAKTKPL